MLLGLMLSRQSVTRQFVTRQNVTRQIVTRQNVAEPVRSFMAMRMMSNFILVNLKYRLPP